MGEPSVPSVAIIITVFNDGRFLDEALGSALDLQSASQDLAGVSILVADDGSTERRTVAVLERLARRGVSVLRLAHRGTGAVRNSALRIAEADWFVPLDADNRLRPSMLSELLPIGDGALNVALVYGDAIRFGNQHGRWCMGPTDVERLQIENHIDSCGLIRYEAWRTVNGYSESLAGLEDWDLWLRFLENGFDLTYQPVVTFDYRVRSDSLIHRRNLRKVSGPTPLTERQTA